MTKGALSEFTNLRVKVGPHEFEAEVPRDSVAAHFKTWQQLIAAPPATEPAAEPAPAPGKNAALDIFTVDTPQKLITLRVYPTGKTQHADAALLILYGYHECFGKDGQAVDVTRMKNALAASGHRDARVDRTLAPHVSARLVAKVGRRRGGTYQLTTIGYQRAAELARTLHATFESGQ